MPSPTRSLGTAALLAVLALCTPPHAAAAGDAAAQTAQMEQATSAYAAGDLAQAQAAFQQLARSGHTLAQFNLAMMHVRGEVPQPDLQEARRLLEQASTDDASWRSPLALGQMHEQGLLGAPDLPQAMRWYRLAAERGSVDGQVALATAYYLGRGLGRDLAQAAHWYREAAKGGDVGAQYLIASMYEHGDGVAQDLRLARYWYEAAARNGDEAAPGKLKELDGRMVPST
jgi:TPR repeat protein